ncbi:MAG TPA: S16 family serine protease [Alphaproteobacteria bacterium]|nr:S16 family serine protease [Alphaproteobacteria bacterium]
MSKYLKLLIILLLPLAAFSSYAASEYSGKIDLLTVSESNNTERGGIAHLSLVVEPGSGRIFIDSFPLSKIDTQITMRFASEVACDLLERDCSNYDFFYTITANSAVVGGPSAGAAATVLTVAVLDNQILDNKTIMTGTINSGNLVGPVAGIPAKTRVAQDRGYERVIIPRWDNVNNTPDEELSIEVIPVSTLEDALFYFTGKNYSKNIVFDESSKAGYNEIMRGVTADLCSKYSNVEEGSYSEDDIVLPSLSNYGINSTINNLTNISNDNFLLAQDALLAGSYYSAASFCFGGNVKITHSILKTMSNSEVQQEYVRLLANLTEAKRELEVREASLNTISELETYMIVAERLSEASEILYQMNPENVSRQEFAYAIERYNTAKIWSRFYDLEGQEFVMDEDLMKVVCSKKLSEAEERLNYLEMYYPDSEIRYDLSKAYDYYSRENYPLCIFTSSKVKAESDVVLSAIFISANDTVRLFDEKMFAAQKAMARQAESNIFPILGYSYYEYANNLKDADIYSSLLYAEYSLELSNLDMYFKKKELLMLPLDDSNDALFMFVAGLILGAGVTLIGVVTYLQRRNRNNVKNKHTSHEKHKKK